jgi:toxin ParE1/3/4
MKVRWLTGALRSMRTVQQNIALDNPAAANRAADRIEHAIARLADFPLSGRLGTVEGTRELVVAGLSYVVVYRVGYGKSSFFECSTQSRNDIADPWERSVTGCDAGRAANRAGNKNLPILPISDPSRFCPPG